MDVVLSVPFATVAGVLALAGVAKLRSPLSARRALAAAGLPSGKGIARGIGTGEVALAALCLVAPGRATALALALAFAAFAAFLVWVMRAEAGSVPCGCFGDDSLPVTRAHVGFDLVAAAVAAAAVLVPPVTLSNAGAGGVELAALLIGVGCCVYLCYLIFTLLPTTWASYEGLAR
jgi:hypothetical protein